MLDHNNTRLKNKWGIEYYTKELEGNKFILIQDHFIEELIQKQKIMFNNIKAKYDVNKCYQICDLPDSFLLQILPNKFVLISEQDVDLLTNHKYAAVSSLKLLAQHIGKRINADSTHVHHRMEYSDNRRGTLETLSGRHTQHGSHRVMVIIDSLKSFDSFVNYIQYTQNNCFICAVTNAGSKIKYIKDLKQKL